MCRYAEESKRFPNAKPNVCVGYAVAITILAAEELEELLKDVIFCEPTSHLSLKVCNSRE